MTTGLAFDLAHLLAGSLVLLSFMLLYQDRMFGLLNVFALHACVLALSVAWQAYIQAAPHLYVTAAIALLFKGIAIPIALHRIVLRLGIHRTIETVVGVGLTMLAGIGLVALAIVVMLLGANFYYFPDPPRKHGFPEIGLFVGLWYLAVVLLIVHSVRRGRAGARSGADGRQ